MKFKIIITLLFITSCANNLNYYNQKKPFNSKGFAYIYNEKDFLNKIINKKLDNNALQAAHNKLSPGTLVKLINPKTKDSVVLKISKRVNYPDFYKILITTQVANNLKILEDLPLIEVLEIKKNKSFIAEKSKIYSEEKKIFSNAPVESVKIDNISKVFHIKKKINDETFSIVIGEFYSKNSALELKKRIIKELTNFDDNKLNIIVKKSNKIILFSGPYNSINLIKNDYIHLKNFGFEELDIEINE